MPFTNDTSQKTSPTTSEAVGRVASRYGLALIVIGLIVAFVIGDSLFDTYVLRERPLVEELLTPDPSEIWNRFLVSTLVVIAVYFSATSSRYRIRNEALAARLQERQQAERDLKKAYEVQTVLGTLLRVSLFTIPLNEMLKEILQHLSSVPWLALESKGAIFLVEDHPNLLVLRAQHGLAAPLLSACARVPFGYCLCGRAAASGEVEFAAHLDDRHDIVYEGISRHGHYCVPLRSSSRVLGVITLYVREGHRRDEAEVELLEAVANVLAGTVERKQAEEGLEKRLDELEAVNKVSARRLQYLAALREIDRVITSSLDLRFTLGEIVRRDLDHLGSDAADVLLFNSSSYTLEFATGRGFRTRGIEQTRLTLGEGHAGRVALERRVHFANLREEPDECHRAALLAGEEFVGFCAVPLITKGLLKGVLEIYHRSQLDRNEEWLDFLNTLGGQTAIAIDNDIMFDGLQRSNTEVVLAYDATIEGWSRALDLRDKETEGHSRRVTDATVRLARILGLGEDELVHVRRGALLHDIGKMGVPDGILLKPGPLNDEEYAAMKRHPALAFELLSPIRYLRPALEIPYCHHEKWDGTGYPRGLEGEQIPLAARIFALVDIQDALRSDRPYRLAWPEEKVRDHIRSLAGTHLDPQVVQAWLES